MIITGTDPSFRNWGTAHAKILDGKLEIASLGLQQTAKNKTIKRRSHDDIESSRSLFNFFQESISKADVLITELPSGSQSASAAKAYGVCIGILSSCSIPLIGVSPLEVKLCSVGDPKATKREMIEWATGLYPHLNWKTYKRKGEIQYSGLNEHMADAISAIHAGIKTEEFQKLIKEQI